LAPPGEQANIFFRLWPLKGAFIKATGEGLSRPLDSFFFSFAPVRIALHPSGTTAPVVMIRQSGDFRSGT
jgi:4'-phosphopantetheinyl transferase